MLTAFRRLSSGRSGQSAVHGLNQWIADCPERRVGSAGHCRFQVLFLPVASATRRPTISDRGRFEIIGTGVYTLSVGLL